MLDVPIFQGSGVYCIDAVEVTYGAYGDFYDANPSTAAQPSYCSWNDTWTPTADWPFLPANSEVPVAYVNWCQASAFCSYSGKRLCGQIGGGSVPQASFADFHTDQWFNACTSEGVNCSTTGCYPYGQAYDSAACNGADPSGAPEPSTLLPACEGGSPLLYQMSGNVAEWEDSCATTAGMSDACSIRGGSFADAPAALRCDSGQSTPITQPRSYTGPDVGFRCCL
jgi:formylglycine-generating enzyme required for sulfatase activity